MHETSRWFNIPVAAIGLVGYLLLVGLAIARPLLGKPKWRMLTNLSFIGTLFGFLASVYFMYTAVAVIHATCQWCVASAVIMTASLIATGWLWSCEVPDAEPSKTDSILAMGSAILAIGSAGAVSMILEAASDVPKPTIGSLGEAEILPVAAKVRGDANAPVTILEFADFNCGGCRFAAPEMEKLYKEGAGKIRWAFRNYPLVSLKGHETSMHAATISELAATKGLFWKFFDMAFAEENTERMKSVGGVKQIAMEAGLDIKEVNESLTRTSTSAKAVTTDLDMALRLNVKQTPTFLILANGVEPKAVSGKRLLPVIKGSPYKELIWGK